MLLIHKNTNVHMKVYFITIVSCRSEYVLAVRVSHCSLGTFAGYKHDASLSLIYTMRHYHCQARGSQELKHDQVRLTYMIEIASIL